MRGTFGVKNRRKYSKAKFVKLCSNRERLDTPDFLGHWKRRKARAELLMAELEKGRTAVFQIVEEMYHGGCPKCGALMKVRFRHFDNEPFFGCCRYPDCSGVRNITAGLKELKRAVDHVYRCARIMPSSVYPYIKWKGPI